MFIRKEQFLEALKIIEDLKKDCANIDEDQIQVILKFEIVSLILLKKWERIGSILEGSRVIDMAFIEHIIGVLDIGESSNKIAKLSLENFMQNPNQLQESFTTKRFGKTT